MFLKRLEISGFKSFAKKSIIDFDSQENITSIVGPNGSGKSNVADAIRWVLGEQSYKTIRSKKSEDIIFSGSNGKGRASGARVSMILDNSDGRAPIDFTEVEIERSIYRDGTSEYLINGKKVRLFDVAELLAKSGFGQSTYSVIGQGMVDTMLFYGPAERKVLFDEAAGVRQYELKREQTIRRLSDTAQNIIRIKDILYELSPRLKTLKKQAQKAKQKDEIAQELSEKQKIYFASIWENLSHSEGIKRKDLNVTLLEEEKIKNELFELNKKFENTLSQEKNDSSSLGETRARLNRLEEEKEKIRQEIYTKKAQLEIRYPDTLSKKELEKKIDAINSEIDSLKIEEKESAKKALENKIALANFEGTQLDILKLDEEKNSLREEFYILKAKLEVLGSKRSLTAKEIEEKVSDLNSQLNDLRISEKEKSQLKLQEKMDRINHKIEKNKEKMELKKRELSLLKEELESFDLGSIGEELAVILEKQNTFVTKISSAQDILEIKKISAIGQKVTKSLQGLMEKVSGAKKGILGGAAEIQSEIEDLSSQKESLANELSELRVDLLEGLHLISSLIHKRSEIKNSIKELESLEPVNENEKSQIEKKLKEINKKIGKIDAEVQLKSKELNRGDALKKELLNIDYSLEIELHKKRELENNLEKVKSIKPIDSNKRVAFEKEISLLENRVEEINKQIVGARKILEEGLGSFSEIGKKLSEIKEEITSKQSLLNQYNQEITTIKIDLAKVETKKQDLKEEINRELGGEEGLANVKGILEIDEYSFRTEIEKLKTRLYAIGEIDADVEAEHQEVEARVNYLDSQVLDLEKAKEDLDKLIKELDKKIKKQFEASFEKISEKFRHFFDLLFDGGEAKLELVIQKEVHNDNEGSGEEGAKRSDKLGIEITAIPPGKRVKSLSALSGGERTLTSLALLFAILSVNPAPFVVLDEVDAALDEPNTKRFIKIVHELSKSTQFIFITHNRETMKEASVIYGVTMDDTHVSRLLSVKLEDANKSLSDGKK